jgi:hypothetical protein
MVMGIFREGLVSWDRFVVLKNDGKKGIDREVRHIFGF